jgi:hypothetical protein
MKIINKTKLSCTSKKLKKKKHWIAHGVVVGAIVIQEHKVTQLISS